MPSDREAESTSWLLSGRGWDGVRSVAGWARRQGRHGEAEALMVDVRQAIEEIAQRHPVYADYLRARRTAHGQARRRGRVTSAGKSQR